MNGSGVEIAIVMVVYKNDVDQVAQLVTSLKRAIEIAGSICGDVVIVNNDNVRLGYKPDDGLRIVEGHGNVGFAAGTALGAEQTDSQYLFFVNPDCAVANPHDISDLFKGLEDLNEIRVPMIKTISGAIDYRCYEAWVFTPVRKVSAVVCWIFLHRSSQCRIPRLVKIPGTAVLMSSTAVQDLDSPFSREFFLYGEDRDLTFRARKARYSLRLVRSASIRHDAGESGRSVPDVVVRSKWSSNLLVAERRYGRAGRLLMNANLHVEKRLKACLRRPSLIGRS